MKKACFFLACLAVLLLAPAPKAHADDDQDAFNNAVSDLRLSPDDLALRKNVIRLSRELDALPKPSEKQVELAAKAAYLHKNASDQDDLLEAIKAYQKASLLAPWDGVLYYNQGVVEQEAQLPGDAIRDFNLYLLAQPNAPDRDKVLARLGKLDALLDKKKVEQASDAEKQRLDAINAKAKQSWDAQQAGGMVVLVLGSCALAGGIVELALGYSDESSAGYTVAPGYNSGTYYGTLYEGKYWSSASLSQYQSGQSQVEVGWIVGGVGLAGIVVGALIMPAPFVPQTALLNYNAGRLALAVPPMGLTPRGSGLETTLFNARF